LENAAASRSAARKTLRPLSEIQKEGAVFSGLQDRISPMKSQPVERVRTERRNRDTRGAIRIRNNYPFLIRQSLNGHWRGLGPTKRRIFDGNSRGHRTRPDVTQIFGDHRRSRNMNHSSFHFCYLSSA
jgi:hypothetical protein